MKTPAHPGRIGAWMLARDGEDACRLLRWLSHYVPGLRTELECGGETPRVWLECHQSAANTLADIYDHFGRAGQEERDAAAGAGGWEE